jgi:hypothetical protein
MMIMIMIIKSRRRRVMERGVNQNSSILREVEGCPQCMEYHVKYHKVFMVMCMLIIEGSKFLDPSSFPIRKNLQVP